MNLMLIVTLVWVTLGMFAPRFGRREQVAVYFLATGMTLLYFVFPQRYM